jgi:hypothetical protein
LKPVLAKIQNDVVVSELAGQENKTLEKKQVMTVLFCLN